MNFRQELYFLHTNLNDWIHQYWDFTNILRKYCEHIGVMCLKNILVIVIDSRVIDVQRELTMLNKNSVEWNFKFLYREFALWIIACQTFPEKPWHLVHVKATATAVLSL